MMIRLAPAAHTGQNDMGEFHALAQWRPAMPEQANLPPADATVETAVDGPVNGSGHDRFWDRDDVLEASPLERESIGELRWAHEQEACGAFAGHAGKYLGIVNRTVQAAGGDPGRVIDEAARNAAVPLERVALFHVEMAD
jgi:hypothetical protein